VTNYVLFAAATASGLSSILFLALWRIERGAAGRLRSRVDELYMELAATRRRLRHANTQRVQAQRRARQEHVVAEQLAIQQSAMETRSVRQVLAALDSRLARQEKRLAGRAGDGFQLCHIKRNAVQTMLHTLIANRLDRDLAEAARDLAGTAAEPSGDPVFKLIRERATELLRDAATPLES